MAKGMSEFIEGEIYILYCAAIDMERKCLDALKVAQYVTDIIKLQGEKRIYSQIVGR